MIIILEISIVVLLALFNGFLAMSEMALVSSRSYIIHKGAKEGHKGLKAASKLMKNPSNFLASIQIGITMVGILSGVFGGANLATILTNRLNHYGVSPDFSNSISITIIVFCITLLNLIVGELVPKKIALSNPEALAGIVAPVIQFISTTTKPFVWFLTILTELVFRILKIKDTDTDEVTNDEVKTLIERGTKTGLFRKEDELILKKSMRIRERTVGNLMTVRTKVIAFEQSKKIDHCLEAMSESNRTYFPVYKDSLDHIVGMVSLKKIIAVAQKHQHLTLKAVMEKAHFVAENIPSSSLLKKFKESSKHFAIVIDEYGGLAGVVTVVDILESIVGEIPEEYTGDEVECYQRIDGSWVIDGQASIEEFCESVGISYHKLKSEYYSTVAGFILFQLGHIPKLGETFRWNQWVFEVVDLDAQRIDKILVYPIMPVQNLKRSTKIKNKLLGLKT